MVRRTLGLLACVSVLSISSVAHADDAQSIEELRAMMSSMMKRIDALEKENKELKTEVHSLDKAAIQGSGPQITSHAQLPPPNYSAVEPSSGDGMKIPGTDTTVKLGGYVKADFITDVGSDYGADFARFAGIPLDGSAADSKSSGFHAHARQTRLNLTTKTPTEIGCIPSAQVGQIAHHC
ncbi:MAG: porin [Alcanivorax sp.]